MSGSNTCTSQPYLYKPLIPGRPRLRFVDGAADGGAGGGAGGGGDEKKDEFKPVTYSTQEELDRAFAERVRREREKYSDYDKFKADSAELAALKDKQRTEDQKALDAAREEGRAEVLGELHQERAINALDKALTGRTLNAPSVMLGLDLTRFIKDGKVDGDAITAWVADNSTETKQETKRDPGQGGRESGEGTVEAGKAAYERRHPTKDKQ